MCSQDRARRRALPAFKDSELALCVPRPNVLSSPRWSGGVRPSSAIGGSRFSGSARCKELVRRASGRCGFICTRECRGSVLRQDVANGGSCLRRSDRQLLTRTASVESKNSRGRPWRRSSVEAVLPCVFDVRSADCGDCVFGGTKGIDLTQPRDRIVRQQTFAFLPGTRSC
jgi:hypothetical protein